MNEKQKQPQENKDAPVQPDPETLHTTDPQKHMKGPVSSLMNEARETAETPEKPEEEKK